MRNILSLYLVKNLSDVGLGIVWMSLLGVFILMWLSFSGFEAKVTSDTFKTIQWMFMFCVGVLFLGLVMAIVGLVIQQEKPSNS